MNHPIIEVAEIHLAAGKTEADLIKASENFQKEFLDGQPGFVRRFLTRAEQGRYADVVIWEDRDSARAIMEKASTSEACGSYFSLMETDQNSATTGVSHYEVLDTYPTQPSHRVFCEVVIYSVKKEAVEDFEACQTRLHQWLSGQDGFRGSFRGRNAKAILKWNEEKKDTIAIVENGARPDNIFIDYVFWASSGAKLKADERIKDTDEFKDFSAGVATVHRATAGAPIDEGRYSIQNVDGQILEVAMYTLKKPFEMGLSNTRPDIVRWLEHLGGCRGIMTLNTANDQRNFSDIVLWKDLETAAYASSELLKHDHDRKYRGQFEAVTLYGHFQILGTHGSVGIRVGD